MVSDSCIRTECIYRSIACNTGVGTADIHGTTDSIVYGGGRSVVVLGRAGYRYSTSHYLPRESLVKTVAWVKQSSRELAVVGCEDGSVYVWNVEDTTATSLCKHAGSVVYLTAINVKGVVYVASSGADSKVKINTCRAADNGNVTECPSISIPKLGFAHCCSLTVLHGSVLLALGTDDSTVSLYHVTDNSVVLLTTLTGHTDWVRGLDFRVTCTSNTLLATPVTCTSNTLLASCSQDHYIRLWSIALREEEEEQEFKLKERLFQVDGRIYRVRVESVLLSHENWVTSVRWMSNGTLLSASMDKTLIVWQQDIDGLWMEKVHVGEVGGNNMGLFGALPTSDTTLIVSHSFQGAFQAWRSTGEDGWVGVPMPGGHAGPVKDLSWAPSGHYLISASTDQTVRVLAAWLDVGWYEIARSQVHGHDMSCVDFISDYRYVSGSEEKVLRVFQATSTFFSNLNAISSCNMVPAEGNIIGAHIPALGLSNKAITPEDMANSRVQHEGTPHVKDSDIPYQVAFAPATLTEPPVEEILLQNTLWPELHKLYGHGYEVYQCAAAPDGSVLATCCRASSQPFAAVLLWECHGWNKVAELSHHNLTVTRMKFSSDSRLLLTVSRDRQWAVWDVSQHLSNLLATSPPKSHSRIIWDCAWFRDLSFATVSRDKKLKIWGKQTKDNGSVMWSESLARTLDSSITAIDVSPCGVILLGFESGDISILRLKGMEIELLETLHQAATLAINTVQWRPGTDQELLFAACSQDMSLVLVRVELLELCIS